MAVDLREVTLERFKLVALQYIPVELLQSFGEEPKISISTNESFMFDQLVVRVVQSVWGREMEQQEHRWPANWWQAFKDRWFPKWAKNRWPVHYSTCTLTARELYPKVSMPERAHRVVILKSIDERKPERTKCPYCGHMNLARAGCCAYCDEYLG